MNNNDSNHPNDDEDQDDSAHAQATEQARPVRFTKAKFSRLVDLASRGSLLSEFLDSGMANAEGGTQLAHRYTVELHQIETQVLDLVLCAVLAQQCRPKLAELVSEQCDGFE